MIPGIQGVVFGVAIVAVIMLAPEGLVPKFRDARGAAARPHAGRRDARSLDEPVARAALQRRDGAHRREVVLRRRERLALVRRPAGGAGRELRRAPRRGPRHHRPERRRQDDAVQPPERLHPRRTPGEVRFEGTSLCRPQAERGSAASASAARSRWCGRSRACRCSTTWSSARSRAERDDARAYAAARDALARVGPRRARRRGRRRAHDGRAAPDGARARARVAAEAAAARRDARRARLAGDRRACSRRSSRSRTAV